jgi:hypothetical protein
MKYILLVSIIILISGCATSKQTIGPSGRPVFSIACGALVMYKCLEKAGEVCPRGYEVISGDGSRYLGKVTTGGISSSGMSTPYVTPNTLLIECK